MNRSASRRLLLAAALVLSCGSRGPQVAQGPGGRGCEAPPLGDFRAFLESGGPSSSTFEAIVITTPPPGDGGFTTIALRQDSGAAHELGLRLPLGLPPLRVGGHYRFQVDYAPGYPPASGILVWDAGGLIYAGASDQQIGRRALKNGVPGFVLALLPSECPARNRNECFDAVKNARLEVRYAGRSARLFQGESATLGGYRIVCLIAQDVTYNTRCSDAGQVAVSYVIERAD